MITGFENITHDLTEYEKGLVPVFAMGFKSKVGKENAVTNKQIVEKLSSKYKITDARVRKIINYIRNKNIIPGLVASSDGYYVTNDPEELKRYISSLDQREAAIREVKIGMLNYLKEVLK